MTGTASTPSPMSVVDRRAGSSSTDHKRAGPSAQGLFEASADLLAAARALTANAGAPGSHVAFGPALACMEASLEAPAEAARRIGEEIGDGYGGEAPAARTSPTMTAGRFDRLADALLAAARACDHAPRTTSTNH